MDYSKEKTNTQTLARPIANARCLAKACEKLDVKYEILDEFGNWLKLSFDRDYHFVNSKSPFNNDGTSYLYKDKGFSYNLLSKEIAMPKTVSYLNPNCGDIYKDFVKFKNVKEIVGNILDNFKLPSIVKMNHGSRGHNIFRVKNRREVARALKIIFNPRKRNYDYVVLVQDELFIHHEYRAIVFKGECLLMYEKVCKNKKDSLSPLHNEDAKTVHIGNETEEFKNISDFIFKSKTLKEIEFGGLDIVVDHEGKMWFLEVNSYPGFSKFTEDNGDNLLVEMYTKILKTLK